MVEFREFLCTGELGNISLGMSGDEILAALGPDRDIADCRPFEVWKYGSLQLTLWQGRLYSFSLYFTSSEQDLPKGLEIEGWLPSRNTTLDEVRGFLFGAGVPFHLDCGLCDECGFTLLVGPGVKIVFDVQHCRLQLWQISFSMTAREGSASPQAALREVREGEAGG